jgi:zinc protease
MQKFKLKNGLTVLFEPRKTDAVAIELCVGTGSNNEHKSIAGISHFLEHMVFEGTKTRTSKQISEAIENIGGELNAATSKERTFYYTKVPKNKVSIGMEILADIIKNPLFEPKILEKERRVVLEEIRMTNDQPILYQWVLFEKSLFKRHPTKNPIYGRFDSVKSITRKNMIDYFRKWYSPKNMIISIVGDVKQIRNLVNKHFSGMKQRKVPKIKKTIEPKDKKPTITKNKRDINQAYFVLGYKTVPRSHKDSFVLDVISSIYSKGLSGRINDEIRVKRGLAYAVGANQEAKKDFGFFFFYLNCAKKNLDLSKSIILDEIRKLSNISNKELGEAKDHIIGRNLLDKENSQKRADELAFWEFIKDVKLADQYTKNIRKVTKKDIIRVRNKYFNKNYTMVVLSK